MIARREAIALLVGAAAWPVAARAQPSQRMRRVGVLMNLASDDRESQARVTAFVQGLQELGWSDGRNLRLEIRWGANDPDKIRRHANELVALSPDVILANATPSVIALKSANRGIPVVFVNVIDPVGAGFVESLARPGGNATGFTVFEYGISAKWLELLKQISPNIARAAVLRDTASPTGIGQLAAMQSVAPALGIELSPIGVRDGDEIERLIIALSKKPDIGLVVTPSTSAITNRELILRLVGQHRLPTIYPFRFFAEDGGLLSYGPETVQPFRRAAAYVDRILNGEKPADLPVQAPTKYALVINLKTARALGLEVPPMLLARADEVIE
jgi:putative ABC transport system substrate-binding protein